MKVTIKDIAEKTGFSISTVSIALNNKEARISQGARQLILDTAKELNYRPNAAAVALRTQRTFTIGMLIPDLRNDFYAILEKGLEDYCQECGWSVMLCSSNNLPSREKSYLDLLKWKSVDGICIALAASQDESPSPSRENMDFLSKLDIPVVLLDMTFYNPAVNAVVCDHEIGGYIAAKHILELGHRDIAIAAGNLDLEGARARHEGVLRAFSEYGVSLRKELLYEGEYTYSSGVEAVKHFGSNHYTAVISASDMIAAGVIHQLTETGKTVPEDVSVTGYDDIALARQLSVPITTVRQPIYEMGREAAKILIDSAESDDPHRCSKVSRFNPELMVRKSTKAI